MGSNQNPAPHHETPTFGNPDLPQEGMVNTTTQLIMSAIQAVRGDAAPAHAPASQA